jgi:hypothetical protein
MAEDHQKRIHPGAHVSRTNREIVLVPIDRIYFVELELETPRMIGKVERIFKLKPFTASIANIAPTCDSIFHIL